MITHREFSAWIVSEGRPLPEYLIAVDRNARKVSCWIPGQAGKNFSVHWKDGGTCTHSCAFISLDGFSVPGRFLFGYGEAFREGVRTGLNTERPFVFMEQPNTSSGGRSNANAGTIALKIRCVTIDGSRPANKVQRLPDPSRSQSHSLCIGYGEEGPAYEQFPRTWNVKHDGLGNRSYVTFVFRYRSRECLLSQGIMPVDDVLQIPPAVRQAHTMNHGVASVPISRGHSMLRTPKHIPSPLTRHNLERMGSALRNAFNPGSVPVRSATNVRTVGMSAACSHSQYPGGNAIDFSPDSEPNVLKADQADGSEWKATSNDKWGSLG
ncbi:hypothetical protein JVT61DRAFT_2494 [Boletus reticuloceps]|uniref:Uncharacterized protein n=1 Tax=Boletus reticuloceps TaxID=495285 RepID=A0A8I3A981_9AGAM|nr:hypothetical protein JVT61DRAFT_2494 [Boletus reticuloceps]